MNIFLPSLLIILSHSILSRRTLQIIFFIWYLNAIIMNILFVFKMIFALDWLLSHVATATFVNATAFTRNIFPKWIIFIITVAIAFTAWIIIILEMIIIIVVVDKRRRAIDMVTVGFWIVHSNRVDDRVILFIIVIVGSNWRFFLTIFWMLWIIIFGQTIFLNIKNFILHCIMLLLLLLLLSFVLFILIFSILLLNKPIRTIFIFISNSIIIVKLPVLLSTSINLLITLKLLLLLSTIIIALTAQSQLLLLDIVVFFSCCSLIN